VVKIEALTGKMSVPSSPGYRTPEFQSLTAMTGKIRLSLLGRRQFRDRHRRRNRVRLSLLPINSPPNNEPNRPTSSGIRMSVEEDIVDFTLRMQEHRYPDAEI